jgi:hypothetical protein
VTKARQLPSAANQVRGGLFSRPRAWAWNLIATPGIRRQAQRDGYCAGLLLGEGYWNQRPSPWYHRDLRAWHAGLRDGAELAARSGQPVTPRQAGRR